MFIRAHVCNQCWSFFVYSPHTLRFTSLLHSPLPPPFLQLIRLVDMLVALTISEDAIYPLIQSYVWEKIGAEPKVLKRVLDSFIRVCSSSCVELGAEGECLVCCCRSDFARYCVYTSIFVAYSGEKETGLCIQRWSKLQMGISDGLGSRKLEVLADTAVTLEQSANGAVVTEVIKKMLKVHMYV